VRLYPLKFAPLYQYRLWGGRGLATLFGVNLPGEGPIGESWLLSDRADHASVVANGALRGQTLAQVRSRWPEQLLGRALRHCARYPLLLKFLDVHGELSVQVHPSDQQTGYLSTGDSGKTEAWVVLGTAPQSRIYAGLTPHTTPGILRRALADGSVAAHLQSFMPTTGDAVLVPAGAVHALRAVLVFEVQENSDVTFRLFDWNQVDPVSHRPRPLQVEEAMDCIDFGQREIGPLVPVVTEATPGLRERLVECAHFKMWRLRSTAPITVGEAGVSRVLVCIAGAGRVRHDGVDHAFGSGEIVLLPAIVGVCVCTPDACMTLLEISPPDESGPDDGSRR
jgi:mannose-6-phosphate isomerase